MRYVLDSSVAFKWYVREIDSDVADRFRAAGHDLISPDIFSTEAAHAWTRAERQGRLVVGQAAVSWADLMVSPPVLFPSLPLTERAIEISSAARIGVYDCIYVALAEQEGRELVTVDAKLIVNLKPTFPFIVALADVA